MDSTVRLWDLTGKANTPLEFLKPIRAGKTGEKKTKSYFRGGIQRIDLEALAKGPMGSRVNEGISSLAWLSDGQFVTVQRGTSRIWDYKRKSPASSFRNRFLKHLSAPHIDFSQGNGLWSILADPGYGRFGGRLAHHDIGTGAELKVGNIDKDCEYPFTGLAIANKKSFALVGHAAHYLAIWNTQKMQEEHRFRGYPLGFYALAISADDRFALGCHGREIVLFDIEKKQEVRRMIGHGDLVKQTVFLRDGKRALSCSLDKTIRLWDIETGKEIRNYSFHTRGVTQVALFPDQSHFLSSGYDKRVCLWEIKGNQPKEVFGNILAERRIRISPNGLGVLFAGYGSNGRLNDGFGLYFADVAK
jgi:WD40 repeat protein